jgi:hypothetical protein
MAVRQSLQLDKSSSMFIYVWIRGSCQPVRQICYIFAHCNFKIIMRESFHLRNSGPFIGNSFPISEHSSYRTLPAVLRYDMFPLTKDFKYFLSAQNFNSCQHETRPSLDRDLSFMHFALFALNGFAMSSLIEIFIGMLRTSWTFERGDKNDLQTNPFAN